jgi:transcription termination factor NusB
MSRIYRLLKLGQAAMTLSDIEITGKNIAEIIRFILSKIPYQKRPYALMKVRHKIWNLDEYDISSKKSPDTAAIGQAITFMKTLLNGKQSGYVRNVITEVVKRL